MHKAPLDNLDGWADFVGLVQKTTWTSPPQRCLVDMQGTAKLFSSSSNWNVEVRTSSGL